MGRPDTEAKWQAIWSRRSGPALWLLPLSYLYGLLASVRRAAYSSGLLRTERLPVPVIVVGNVVVGGAGKTPTVLALLEHLQAKGWTPGVVSRGHGRQGQAVLEIDDDTPAHLGGDEPTLIRRTAHCPVVVGRQRAAAARALLAAHPAVNVLVCDDGLQHLALARNVAVAVFDDRATGNGWLLPAGMLREPWPTRHRFGPQLVLQHSRVSAGPVRPLPLPEGAHAYAAVRALGQAATDPDGQTCHLDDLRGQALTALAGVARPQVFFDMLRQRGLTLAHALPLPDHAGPQHYEVVLAQAQGPLVCTEKDAVKLWACWHALSPERRPPCWAVPLTVSIDPAFFVALDRLLGQASGSALSSAHGHQTA
jgi:tetraacyldisaccharide 4'-kinase